MRVRLVSLGCKVNQYETQALGALFAQQGFALAERAPADVVVLNSCTVTAAADSKSRQMLRRLRRAHPQAVLILTGCMPQAADPETLAALHEADIITGTRDRAAVVRLAQQALREKSSAAPLAPQLALTPFGAQTEAFEPLSVQRFDKTFQRAYLKIEDGCDRFCSYCIIPYARGAVRSRPLGEIAAETALLAAAGYREIVLTGINLSRCGSDLGFALPDAVQAAASVPGDFRLRLGSVEPDLLSRRDWERLAATPKLCPQLHLPLQSGCDETLRRMNRRYTAAQFMQTAQMVRELFGDCAITTDIIVGFPGETEAEFEQTLQTVRSLAFAQAHLFEYSPRAGTPAAALPQVAPQVRRERFARLAALTAETAQQYAAAQVGKTVQVLLEANGGGHAADYLYVHCPDAGPAQVGQPVWMRLIAAEKGCCTGVPCAPPQG